MIQLQCCLTSSLHFCPQYIYQVLSSIKTCSNSIPFKWNPVKPLSLQSSLAHLFVIITKNTELTTTVCLPHGQFKVYNNQMQYHIVSPKFLWSNILWFCWFHDSSLSYDCTVSSSVTQILYRKFCDKKFCNYCPIYGNHENIWPWK